MGTLDRTKPYATVYGLPEDGAAFEQNGKRFDHQGREIGKVFAADENPPTKAPIVFRDFTPDKQSQGTQSTAAEGGTTDKAEQPDKAAAMSRRQIMQELNALIEKYPELNISYDNRLRKSKLLEVLEDARRRIMEQ